MMTMNARKRCAVLVDKPSGITSFGCTAKVKDIFGARKAGHSGTLERFCGDIPTRVAS